MAVEWLETENRRIRALWDEGHSASEIGQLMGRTRNSIIGHAHRLELPARVSPIRRDGPKTPRSIHEHAARRRRQHEATLAGLPSLAPAVVVAAKPRIPAVPVYAQPKPVAAETTFPPCCWPIGDVGTRAFRFCEAQSAPRRPYCEAHCKIAYKKGAD